MPYLKVPSEIPKGYVPLTEEPTFNPSRDLQLTNPTQSWHLSDLGYTKTEIDESGCSLAFTEPFRLLSEEGAARLQEVVRLLRSNFQGGGLERSESKSRLIYVAGGVYRSQFLRELCSSIDVAEFLSELAGIPLAPHSLPSQQIYINYPPNRIDEDIDRWHADSIGFDYVMMATDPSSFEGGEFEVFLGTTAEAAQLLGTEESKLNLRTTQELPSERVVRFEFPAAGYAVFQQGNRVVHRGRRLNEPGDRITVVPGYVSREPHSIDITDLNNIYEVDRIQSNPGSLSIPHNTHVDGNFLITSYYRDGTTVHDITYPDNMIQVAYYDSYSGSGNGFDGCWGTYPFLPSGLIISSDINSSNNGNGKLLIYERGFSQACYLAGIVTDISNGNLLSGVSVEILGTN